MLAALSLLLATTMIDVVRGENFQSCVSLDGNIQVSFPHHPRRHTHTAPTHSARERRPPKSCARVHSCLLYIGGVAYGENCDESPL